MWIIKRDDGYPYLLTWGKGRALDNVYTPRQRSAYRFSDLDIAKQARDAMAKYDTCTVRIVRLVPKRRKTPDAAMEEREAVAAWLETGRDPCGARRDAAKAIRAGEHLR